MSALPICGDCAVCLDRTNALLRVPARATGLPGPRPTAAALERHAKRFGPGQVAETAAELGVDVTVERPRKMAAPRGPSLKKRVAGHLAAGRSVEFIAEWENLTPGRARRLVEEVER